MERVFNELQISSCDLTNVNVHKYKFSGGTSAGLYCDNVLWLASPITSDMVVDEVIGTLVNMDTVTGLVSNTQIAGGVGHVTLTFVAAI